MNYQETAEEYVREQLGEELIYRQAFGGVYPKKIELQHWLRVLDDVHGKRLWITSDGYLMKEGYYSESDDENVCTFNLTTGQPATEADYHNICDILGI